MKINYKNTAIGLLNNMHEQAFRLVDDGGATTRIEKTKLGLSLIKEWPKLKDAFSSNVRYISKTFYEAYNKSVPKLAAVLDSEPMLASGTLIYSPNGGENNTIFYHLSATGKGIDFRIKGIIMVFTSQVDKDKPALGLLVHRGEEGIKEYISKKAKDEGITDMTILADIYTLLLFIKYCDIETKLIDPKKSRREVVAGQKYLNETDKRVTILDCTWFTNLVVSGAFGVSGHLRWQPYGPGLKGKKLIWIDEFQKEGYTRKAKVTIQNENNEQQATERIR